MHSHLPARRRQHRRRGAACVEMALVAPLLTFLFVIAVDFARVFHHTQLLASCARNGALFQCDPLTASESPYKSAEEAAQADAASLTPAPKVAVANGTDTQGHNYVEVTVTHPFRTVVNYPGVPEEITLSRTVRMRVLPEVPN